MRGRTLSLTLLVAGVLLLSAGVGVAVGALCGLLVGLGAAVGLLGGLLLVGGLLVVPVGDAGEPEQRPIHGVIP